MLFVSVFLSLVLICAGIPSGIFQPGSGPPSVVGKETSGSFSAWNLLYRLDVVSCSSAAIPPLNQSFTYSAWPYLNYFTWEFRCYATLELHASVLAGNIITLRSNSENGRYKPHVLEYFHIQCPPGRFARFVTGSSSIELEGRHSIGDQNICLDYVQIKLLATGEKCEICGNEALTDNCGSIVNRTYSYNTSNMLITFRSNSVKQERGFKISIACNANEMEEEGIGECLKTSSSLSWNEYKRMIQSPNYIEYTEAISHVPYDATGILFDFYGDYQYKSLKAPVKSYKGILSLAKIAQKSCDASTRTVAREVQDLFPYSMREEVPYFEEQPTGVEEPMQMGDFEFQQDYKK
ncbi:PREDICTED: uncharacterized protein LOC109581909 [Amphimedon queenslandica]|uniref:CUB domain-containing protein n=1 Tax=Amphimedon queenslandica TaxID=400682 RepID=A0AAN0J5C2_AMPQE|nr:PREDICTED: uncharacterized protein LOC109581909 [Amphimedon queenslandica]|eukprot:XP_019851947.1 PREDICTED: uncharacterized protein LOC109581909 [Amphimedon queenslandica]